MPEQPLPGRTALVTGGAVRLGRALAIRLAAEGANVCIHYGRSSAAAQEVVAELSALGVEAAAVVGDFSTDPAAAADQVVEAATQALGPIDLLINSAAIFEPGTLATTTPDDWQRCLAINLEAPVWLMRAFAARLPADRSGAIVNLVDWRGLRPPPGHLAYTISKAGLIAATRLLARELGPRIQVNAIAPGAILPPPGGDPAAFERLGESTPLGRVGSPEDVADAMMYLVLSRFVTGEVLSVTGGQSL